MLTEAPDVTSNEIYLSGLPRDEFERMRKTDGLSWHPYESNGFWAVTRHADVLTVSKDSATYSSAIGHTNLWDLEADALEARRSLIDSDAPEHTRLRRVVSKAFTPKNIRVWEEVTRQIAVGRLEDFIAQGGGNWVDIVAAPVPINVILTIMGIPLEDADMMIELSNYLVEATSDRQSLAPDAFGNTTDLRLLPFGSPASHALFEYGGQIREVREADPQDDLVTRLIFAEIDGERLTRSEYQNFFQLVVFAGNETTRTAMSHAAIALADNPDQWQSLVDSPELLDSAVEELLRWASPVMHMRRTAAIDTELAGTAIAKGDKVVMWYTSANFDEAVFENPYTLDLGRDPNPHFAFGGGGSHHCLGAFLARMELKVLLEEMLALNMRLEPAGAPVPVPSNFVRGVLSVEMGLSR
ncbi:MAG: cytochrome P450 [Acidimicrobiales bacterium]